MNYYGQLCLSDIPKRLIREYNGKKYLSIEVVERKTVGDKGDTHFISAYCKREERVEGEKRIFGNLKPSAWNDSQQAAPQAQQQPQQQQYPQAPSAPVSDDDLPF